MKPSVPQCSSLVAAAVLAAAPLSFGQETSSSDQPSAPGKSDAVASDPPAGTAAAETAQQQLEQAFIATLTKATMAGRWCLIRDGELTPEKEDKYTIVGVEKKENGSWVIKSRVQYGEFDMVVPVPVKMAWAGDTPVIIVDGLEVPGGKAYSARVIVYDDSYAGTWSGLGVKGLLSGQITREVEDGGQEKEKSEP